ncbi:MAG: amidohydrolase family protein [Methanobrevibacter sp.]|jgi:5-methylthioadenosine/S-adenosylhomocysteine deaminase|nr:amidohydrolase family protein [Methanobrevibacter sp.]
METEYILIKNALILNPIDNDKNKAIESYKGSVLIENDKIIEISNDISSNNIYNNANNNVDKVIDAENKILMPGLINTHTHASMDLFRGLADDMPLHQWLEEHIWPTEAGLNGEYCYTGALLAAIEMIKSGTTTFNDMYFYMEDIAKAVDESGIRASLSYGMIDFGDKEKRENEFKENISLIKNCNNTADGRITTMFGPHSPFTASKELLERVRKEADEYNVGIHIHMNETKKEVEDVVESTGNRPFEYLNDIGFLKDDIIAAHGVWLSEEEIAIIKENNIKISHNPCSNMKLSSGIAPVDKLLNNNVCVSIGTDGAASNNNLDMFEEMKFASLLQKVNTMNPQSLPSDKVLKMATLNGAKSLGLEKEIGSIEVGKKADIILIDTNTPNFTPMSNIPSSNIVYSANGSNVNTTICNGKILMENRKLTNLNEEEILEKSKIAIKELIDKRD